MKGASLEGEKNKFFLEHTRIEMPIGHPRDVEAAVVYTSLKLKRDIGGGNKNL